PVSVEAYFQRSTAGCEPSSSGLVYMIVEGMHDSDACLTHLLYLLWVIIVSPSRKTARPHPERYKHMRPFIMNNLQQLLLCETILFIMWPHVNKIRILLINHDE